MLDRLIPSQFILETDPNPYNPFGHVTFNRQTGPFYEGVRWSVRRADECLSNDGEWEYEPSPSNRDDDFYDRFRFRSLEEAIQAYDIFEKTTHVQ